MLNINENKMISGEEIYRVIESRDSNYSRWIKRAIVYGDLLEGKDFIPLLVKSTGGRPSINYEFTIEAAKEICLLERNEKGKQIRRWLISLSEQKENLEIITVKEAAFAIRVINCLKYIDKQKECFVEHKNKYTEGKTDQKYIYAEFAKYRAKIVGWDKEKIDNALNNFLIEHVGYNRTKILTMSMSDKMSVMDIGEAIKIAVLDILYSKDTDSKLAQNFSNLCKKLAKEMQIQPEKNNQKNLFRDKEVIEDVKKIELK
jgi:phage anti-repressor protein